MKPILQLLKWFFTFWFFMFPVMICGSYFVQGCSKTKWMNFLLESSDISFALLPLTGLVAGFILAAYALQRMYYMRYNSKVDRSDEDAMASIRYKKQQEIRDYVMRGGLNSKRTSDWWAKRFND